MSFSFTSIKKKQVKTPNINEIFVGLRSVLVPPLPQRSTGAKAQVGGFTPEAVQFVMVLPHPLHAWATHIGICVYI